MGKYLMGGAAAGGSLALVTSLLNYLSSIKNEASQNDSSRDDDTLYLNVRKKTDKRASIAGSTAIAGGAMTALGSYALIRHLYQKMKKKEVQAQLDQAQQGYVDVLAHQSKGAAQATPTPVDGQRPGFPEMALSMPGALAVILGLASATVTNKILQRAFPTPKPPGRRGPRRVVLRSADTAAGFEKESALEVTDADEEEFLIRLLMSTKSASLQGFKDLIHGIGQGRHDQMQHGLTEFGHETVFDMVKGASLHELEEPYLSAAIGLATQSPALEPTLSLLAASEFNAHYPTYFKWATALSEPMQEAFCKVAGVMAIAARHDATLPYAEVFEGDKSAAAGPSTGVFWLDTLKDFLMLNSVGGENEKRRSPEGTVNTETTEESTEDDQTSKVIPADAEAQAFQDKHKDVIDTALAA